MFVFAIFKNGEDGLWCLTPLSTINNISVISWRPVLLVDEIGVSEPVASH